MSGTDSNGADNDVMANAQHASAAVFICGMYKSGTSWLLNCLSRHPSVIGVREVDLLRCWFDTPDATPHTRAERLRQFFLRSAFSHVGALNVERAERYLREIADGGGKLFCDNYDDLYQDVGDPIPEELSGSSAGRTRINPHYPISFPKLDPATRLVVLRQVANSTALKDLVDGLTDTFLHLKSNAKVVVFKGADQIALPDLLNDTLNGAKKIIVVRDGRDACLSALCFKNLMAQRQAGWRQDLHVDFFQLLHSWRERARFAIALRDRDDFAFVRYEDLTHDFHGELSRLLDWLKFQPQAGLVEKIEQHTSFERLTGGRRRGEEAEHILRRGLVGEWKDVLGDADKQRAWEIAGRELLALGYGEC